LSELEVDNDSDLDLPVDAMVPLADEDLLDLAMEYDDGHGGSHDLDMGKSDTLSDLSDVSDLGSEEYSSSEDEEIDMDESELYDMYGDDDLVGTSTSYD
jgi:hypothetical protein